jgi:hypothetical protein
MGKGSSEAVPSERRARQTSLALFKIDLVGDVRPLTQKAYMRDEIVTLNPLGSVASNARPPHSVS